MPTASRHSEQRRSAVTAVSVCPGRGSRNRTGVTAELDRDGRAGQRRCARESSGAAAPPRGFEPLTSRVETSSGRSATCTYTALNCTFIGAAGCRGVRKCNKCGQNVGREYRTHVLQSAHALDRSRPHPLPQRTPPRTQPSPRWLARTTRRHPRARLPHSRVPRVRSGHALETDLQLEVNALHGCRRALL